MVGNLGKGVDMQSLPTTAGEKDISPQIFCIRHQNIAVSEERLLQERPRGQELDEMGRCCNVECADSQYPWSEKVDCTDEIWHLPLVWRCLPGREP